jgi:hypothetical protein
MYYDLMPSPVGELTLCSNGAAITGLHIAGDRYFAGPPADWVRRPDDPLLQEARRQLDEYFAGRRRRFDLPLAPAGTPFQRAVWSALVGIPAGVTTSYGELAASIGRPSDQANPYDNSSFKGKVVEITEDGAHEHIEKLSHKYTGKPYAWHQPGEQRVIIKIAKAAPKSATA